MNGSFIQNLGRVYGIYTGAFVVFILLMAILEQLGVSAATIGILFVAFTIAIYALIGFLSRTMQVDAELLQTRFRFGRQGWKLPAARVASMF